MTAFRLGVAALVATSLAAGAALAADREMVLEIIMNGRSTGQLGEFVDRDGTLYAHPSELRDLGFVLPPRKTPGDEPIPLSSLPNVRVRVDEARQTLLVTAGDAALRPTELGGGAATALAPLTPSEFGAVLNYDVLGTYTAGQTTGGALLDARVFGPYGLLQSTGLVNISPAAGEQSVVRLDTTYTFSEPDETRRWRVGDVLSGALAWTRTVRLGGVQVASDFTLRPDLVAYPLPVVSSSAAVPSTVNVMVDGIRQYSAPVQPGPFEARTLPVVSGAGDVAVVVQDALGRQTAVTLPFYASTTLLKPGLASYSVELGAVRQNYGLANDTYTDAALSGSVRYGQYDWLTLEGHGEATDGLTLLGAGAALQVGRIGIANAAVSASSGRGGVPNSGGAPARGGQVASGFQRLSHSLSFGVSGTVATGGYRDLAAVNGEPVPELSLNASVGYQLGKWGSIGLAYVSQRSRAQPAGQSVGGLDASLLSNPHVELATASYSVPVADGVSFYATGFKDLHQARSYGVGFGVSFLLGSTTSASVGGALNNGRSSTAISVAKPALVQDDYGYQIQDSEGFAAQHQADGEYLSRWGRVTAGVSQTQGVAAGRAGASGALAWAGGDLFASDQINDSFAVVQTGGIADVPVLYENRLLGTTDSSGQLLVPSLLSYQNNKLAVDTSRLPADVEVGQTSAVVRPADKSGVVVDFHVRAVKAALLKLQDRNGAPIPLGSVARVAGAPDAPVGYDGEAYVTGLSATNQVEVVLPDGAHCAVRFDYKPTKGDIPVIGPLRCR